MDFSKKLRQARLFFISGILSISCVLSAQEKLAGIQQLAEQRLAERGEIIIRFIKPAGKELEYFTRFLSIDRVCYDTITAYAGKRGFKQFLNEKISYELLQPPSLKQRISNKRSGNWHDRYPSYDDYIQLMDSFSNAYPGLCRRVEFGKSINNHSLLALNISGHAEAQPAVPRVLLSSTIHGDEPLGYYLMLRTIEELLGSYGSDSKIKMLVDSLDIWINPLANPDGTFFESDSSVDGATRFNANQVDLNRNFPDPVKGDHPDNNSWQMETMQMMDFMKNDPPALAANFHGGSEVVNYPWDSFRQLHPDDAWYRHISRVWADTAQASGPPGYMTALDNGITNGYQWYPVYGGRQDYVNYFLHGREVTIELSYNKVPDETSLDSYWNYNRKSLLQFIAQAMTGLTGVVTDSVTGLPVRAVISIPGHDRDNSFTDTDETNGRYFRLTREGTYIFNISAPGYYAKSFPVSVLNGRMTHLNASLSPRADFLLYPNPFSDQLYINISDAGEILALDFTDLTGRRALKITFQVTAAGIQSVRVPGIAPGIYIVNIRYGNHNISQMVVRE